MDTLKPIRSGQAIGVSAGDAGNPNGWWAAFTITRRYIGFQFISTSVGRYRLTTLGWGFGGLSFGSDLPPLLRSSRTVNVGGPLRPPKKVSA